MFSLAAVHLDSPLLLPVCDITVTSLLAHSSRPSRDQVVERTQTTGHMSHHHPRWEIHLLGKQRLLHHQMWVWQVNLALLGVKRFEALSLCCTVWTWVCADKWKMTMICRGGGEREEGAEDHRRTERNRSASCGTHHSRTVYGHIIWWEIPGESWNLLGHVFNFYQLIFSLLYNLSPGIERAVFCGHVLIYS